MGCHTWFYQEQQRTFEEAKQIAYNKVKENKEKWTKMNPDTDDTCIAYGWNQLILDEIIFELNHKLKCIENDDEFIIWNEQPDGNDINYYNPNTKKFYVDNKITHDIIRVGNYPDIKFFSFEEMLKWIENHRNHEDYNTSRISQKEIDKLKEYWDKYPDSMVRFG